MLKLALALPALALITSCSEDSQSIVPAAEAAALGAQTSDARCQQYPIPFRVSPGAKQTAALELAQLSPSAVMSWDDARGTLTNIARLNVPLPGCTDGADVSAQIRLFLSAHPDLFQVDVNEWPVQPEFNCAFVPDGFPADLTMGRLRFANHEIRHDIFQVSVKKIAGVVNVTTVTGNYLPVAHAGLDKQLSSCDSLTEAQAAATTAATVLEAPVYQGEFICQPSGTLGYVLQSNDLVALRGDEWDWSQDATGVALHATRTLRVTVNPANYTPELISSGARCPVGEFGDDFTIGWDIIMDVHTGEILFVKPGLDCVVC